MSFLVLLIVVILWISSNKNSDKINELLDKINLLEIRINNLQNKIKKLSQNETINTQTTQEPTNVEIAKTTYISQDKTSHIEIHSVENNEPTRKINDDEEEYIGLNFSKDSLEKLFMGNLFKKIGAIILIIAVIIFIQLSGIEFSPLFKILTTYVFSIGFILFSFKLYEKENKDSTKNFAQILWGIGLAASFIATYCAGSLYQIMPNWLSLLIGLSLMTFTLYISKKYNSISALVIGSIGGYLMPFFSSTYLSDTFLISYLIFINLIGIAFVARNNDKIHLNIFNLLASSFVISIFSTKSEQNLSIITPILFWLTYFLNDLYYNIKGLNNKQTDALNWLNLAVLVALVNVIYQYSNPTLAGIVLLFAAAFYLGVYLAFYSQRKNVYAYHAIASIIGSTFFLSEGITRICLFGVEALLISLLSIYYKTKYIQRFILILATFIFIGFITQNEILLNTTYQPFFNERAILILIPALCFLLSSTIFKKLNNNTYHGITLLYSITLFFTYLAFELNTRANANTATNILLSALLCFIYSINSAKLIKAYLFKYISLLPIIIYSFAYLLLIIGGAMIVYSNKTHYFPVLNALLLTNLTAIAAFLYIKKETVEIDFKNYFILTTISLAIYSEGHILANFINLTESGGIISSILLSIFAFITMVYGIAKNTIPLKKFGIGLLLLMLIKILLIDLAGSEAYEKLVAFMVMGIIMLIVSYYYNKKTDV
ncbi:MAG: DUF2339 domain-containing protein [Candidatus Gastranaerophilales bacterium]|nr:DUF2339 domain-containing protein [Candidatus Gastranaerophilales bacterium]